VLYGSSAGLDISVVLGASGTVAGSGPAAGYMDSAHRREGARPRTVSTSSRRRLRARQPGEPAAGEPQAGRRISWQYLADERRALTPAEYARERLGWWEPRWTRHRGDIDLIRGQSSPIRPLRSPLPAALAIDVPPDRSKTSLAVVWRARIGAPDRMVTAYGPATACRRSKEPP